MYIYCLLPLAYCLSPVALEQEDARLRALARDARLESKAKLGQKQIIHKHSHMHFSFILSLSPVALVKDARLRALARDARLGSKAKLGQKQIIHKRSHMHFSSCDLVANHGTI